MNIFKKKYEASEFINNIKLNLILNALATFIFSIARICVINKSIGSKNLN